MSDEIHRQAARAALTDKDQALELLAHLVSQLDPKDVLALIPDTAYKALLDRLAEITATPAHAPCVLTVHGGTWHYVHGRPWGWERMPAPGQHAYTTGEGTIAVCPCPGDGP